jgi:hypothetical protein
MVHIAKVAAQDGNHAIIQYLIEKHPKEIEKHHDLIAIATQDYNIETDDSKKVIDALLRFWQMKPEKLQQWLNLDSRIYDQSVMYKAIDKNLPEVVRSLTPLAPWEFFSPYLAFAVERGNIEIVEDIFVRSGINRVTPQYKKTSLRVAVEQVLKYKSEYVEYCNRLKILCGLLGSRSILTDSFGYEDKDMDKITPLYIAVENNLVDVVKLLLLRNADCHKKCTPKNSRTAMTPMELAAKLKFQEIVEIFESSPPAKIVVSMEARDREMEIFHEFANSLFEDMQHLLEPKAPSAPRISRESSIRSEQSREKTSAEIAKEQALKQEQESQELVVREYFSSHKIAQDTNALHTEVFAAINALKQETELASAYSAGKILELTGRISVIMPHFQEDHWQQAMLAQKILTSNHNPYGQAFVANFIKELRDAFVAAQAIHSGLIDTSHSENLGKVGQVCSFFGGILGACGTVMMKLDHNQQTYNISNFRKFNYNPAEMDALAIVVAVELLQKNLHIEAKAQGFIEKLSSYFERIMGIKTDDVTDAAKAARESLRKAIGFKDAKKEETNTLTPEQEAGKQAAEIAAKLILAKIFEGIFDPEGDLVARFISWVNADFNALDEVIPCALKQEEYNAVSIESGAYSHEHKFPTLKLPKKITNIVEKFKNSHDQHEAQETQSDLLLGFDHNHQDQTFSITGFIPDGDS